MKQPVVWVINTHSTGELRCREGIAEKINPQFSIQYIQGKSPAEIEEHYNQQFRTSQLKGDVRWPDFIISSGVHSTEAARTVKRLSGGRTFIIQNLNPKEKFSEFDLIAIPEHLLKQEHKHLRNHITTIGVPHAITQEKIEVSRAIWKERFSHLPEPRIAVLLGGHTRGFAFTPALARTMAKELNAKVKDLGGSLIVTTSRRTDSRISNAFFEEITVPSYQHDWNRTDVDNPYMGILGCADAIVATGDSMSMCCEANASKKPVYIYSFDGVRAGLRNLHTQLYRHHLAKPFKELIEKGVEPWAYTPLDAAGFVAEEAITRQKTQPRKQAELVVNNNIARRIVEQKAQEMADQLFSATIEGLKLVQKATAKDPVFNEAFVRAVEMIGKARHGRILITGVGKSLRVGELVGASFGSLSIPCEILDPTHAVHGDLGKMQPGAGDILIAISKSGSTEELKPIIAEAQERGLNIIALTHGKDSFLEKAVKEAGTKGICLRIPETTEPSPFLNNEGTEVSPPTVSTTQVKVLMEAIGLSVAQLKGIEIKNFQRNHPAGKLGKQMAK
ncbi:MAG: ELM1/GtrOC1 family putative glycosyltransferase [Rickettsiales bacterium]